MTGYAKTRRAWKYLLLGLMLAAAWGCGVKTAPYPAEAVLPGPAEGLGQFISETGELVLSWKAPTENMVGRPLASLGGFAIEMSENPASDAYCETCPHRYERVDQVPALTPPPGLSVAPGPYIWRYKLAPGRVYRFRVLSVAAGGGIHPGSSVTAQVWAIPAPAPLASFEAVMRDRAVELRWPRPPAGYRAEVEKLADGQWRAIPDLESNSGRYVDLQVEYERSYGYRGRLAALKGETRAVGPWSTERTVKVVDLTPPNPPGYLDAALGAGGVRLSWESLAFDPDLAGYRVYRRLSGEEAFTRVSGLLRENTFFDPITLSPDLTAHYRVTAVDGSPAANESGPSPTAEAFLDPPAPAPVKP